MNDLYRLNLGLGSLPLLSDAETRSISAENPTGERANGAKAAPKGTDAASMLGEGWKVRPCITLEPASTTCLADIQGPGVIQHIWITVHPKAYRDTILRVYWDGETSPSIEAPLGDFFCNGHALRYDVNSLPMAVNPVGGFNSYWQMPFREGARITLENQHPEEIRGFFYQITYALTEIPESAAYFHAQWRRGLTTREVPEHVLVDGIEGQGHYVGTFLAWTQLSNGWWGEGEIKFFVDGDDAYPTICGTGTEDYFGGAWGFGGETYSTPFLGYPLYRKEPGEVPRHGLYRWHIFDPIRFKQDLKVTIQALGWWPNGKYEPLTDDIASVAYWYQTEPHVPFPNFPPRHERWSR
ncbi:MAG: glycoside hydrolase family 172 protein [Anaerolineae bacterium]